MFDLGQKAKIEELIKGYGQKLKIPIKPSRSVAHPPLIPISALIIQSIEAFIL